MGLSQGRSRPNRAHSDFRPVSSFPRREPTRSFEDARGTVPTATSPKRGSAALPSRYRTEQQVARTGTAQWAPGPEGKRDSAALRERPTAGSQAIGDQPPLPSPPIFPDLTTEIRATAFAAHHPLSRRASLVNRPSEQVDLISARQEAADHLRGIKVRLNQAHERWPRALAPYLRPAVGEIRLPSLDYISHAPGHWRGRGSGNGAGNAAVGSVPGSDPVSWIAPHWRPPPPRNVRILRRVHPASGRALGDE